VTYIVINTLGRLLNPDPEQFTAKSAKNAKDLKNLSDLSGLRGSKRLTPVEVAKLKIVDPACGAPRGAIKQYLKGKETPRIDSSMPQYC
jgi:hypothetical protein